MLSGLICPSYRSDNLYSQKAEKASPLIMAYCEDYQNLSILCKSCFDHAGESFDQGVMSALSNGWKTSPFLGISASLPLSLHDIANLA